MRIVLDTHVVSELRKARLGRADPRVLRWAASLDADDLFVSVITLLELELGVLQIERRDAAQGAVLRRWLEQAVLPEFAERSLSVDAAVARCCARLHLPGPRSERDALIAATALVHGMTVATRNVIDFEPMGVPVCNPWAGE